MLVCKTRRWGNSIGILIPKEEVKNLDIKEDQTIVVDIIRKENPLKELFGFGKKDKITKNDFLTTRKLFETRTI